MKKFFEEAEIEVVKFDVADVITTSEESFSDVDVSESRGFDSGYEEF